MPTVCCSLVSCLENCIFTIQTLPKLGDTYSIWLNSQIKSHALHEKKLLITILFVGRKKKAFNKHIDLVLGWAILIYISRFLPLQTSMILF